MSPEAWALLTRRLDNEPPIVQGDELQRAGLWPPDHLVGLGLVEETSPSGSAACWGCGQGYVGHVELFTDATSGQRRGYIPCRECGPVEVRVDSLRRWRVNILGLLSAVATLGGIRGPIREAIPGYLWRIGRAKWSGRLCDVYFARQAEQEVQPRIVESLRPSPTLTLFLPTERSRIGWKPEVHLVFALESVVGLTDNRLTFDRECIEESVRELGGSQAPTKRRPRKRADRAAKIELLVKEMVAHLRTARDHAFATMESKGGPKLLPRPTQKQLAARTGLTEADVSRCLGDPAARELKLYWDLALNLQEVIDWHGRPGR